MDWRGLEMRKGAAFLKLMFRSAVIPGRKELFPSALLATAVLPQMLLSAQNLQAAEDTTSGVSSAASSACEFQG